MSAANLSSAIHRAPVHMDRNVRHPGFRAWVPPSPTPTSRPTAPRSREQRRPPPRINPSEYPRRVPRSSSPKMATSPMATSLMATSPTASSKIPRKAPVPVPRAVTFEMGTATAPQRAVQPRFGRGTKSSAMSPSAIPLSPSAIPVCTLVEVRESMN